MPKLSDFDRLERSIMRRFSHAMKQYGLVVDGDRVLAAVSGGKDSLCMLELLGRRMQIDKPSFRVEAVHVRVENVRYETDTSYLTDFAAQYGIPMHVITTAFPASDGSKPKPECFLCSWSRRKAMFKLAQQIGCNKLALGHNNDDVIHTAMMNVFYEGRFAAMPARLRMRKMPLTIIRPLCLVPESDIRRYAEARRYEPQRLFCPYEKASRRADMRRLFDQIEQLSPDARFSVWRALDDAGKTVED